MKSKYMLLFFLVFTGFISCKKDSPAVVYNDTLVFYKNKADNDFISLNNKILESLKDTNFYTIEYITAATVDSLSSKLDSLRKINIPSQGENFYVSLVEYIETLKKVAGNYHLYSLLTDENVSMEKIDSIREVIKQAEAEVETATKKLVSAQEDYAEASNIRFIR